MVASLKPLFPSPLAAKCGHVIIFLQVSLAKIKKKMKCKLGLKVAILEQEVGVINSRGIGRKQCQFKGMGGSRNIFYSMSHFLNLVVPFVTVAVPTLKHPHVQSTALSLVTQQIATCTVVGSGLTSLSPSSFLTIHSSGIVVSRTRVL